MELHAIDPRSTAFRYAQFSDAERVHHQIDLGNLKSVMGGIAAFLDALQDYWENR
jgi:hypothetical protein